VEQLTLVVAGGLMLGVALAVMRRQLRRWRELDSNPDAEQDQADRLFYLVQYRRRTQMSGMLALMGLAIAATPLAPPDQFPSLFVGLWMGVGLLACWVGLLAALDLRAIQRHAVRLAARLANHRGQLEAEVRRYEVKRPPDEPAP
jgi:hypothetical protein